LPFFFLPPFFFFLPFFALPSYRQAHTLSVWEGTNLRNGSAESPHRGLRLRLDFHRFELVRPQLSVPGTGPATRRTIQAHPFCRRNGLGRTLLFASFALRFIRPSTDSRVSSGMIWPQGFDVKTTQNDVKTTQNDSERLKMHQRIANFTSSGSRNISLTSATNV